MCPSPAATVLPGLSLTGRLWRFAAPASRRVASLARQTCLPRRVVHYLYEHGYTTAEAIPDVLHPCLERLPSPDGMLHYRAAVNRLRTALERKESIRIVGDYDCDGTMGLLVLRQALETLAGNHRERISWYIPDRQQEGYGLNRSIVERAAADGVQVLISVDIGITAHAEWELARSLGITGICIDHHTVLGSRVPEAAIVVCPRQLGDPYPDKHLAACGLAWLLIHGLLADCPGREEVLAAAAPLAAIGTYADLVPLTSPANRALVQRGLSILNRGPHSPGLQALLAEADLAGRTVTDSDLGFRLAPLINAAGRIAGTTASVVELMDSPDVPTARSRAARLGEWNETRQKLQLHLTNHIRKHLLDGGGEVSGPLVLSGPEAAGWHPGIVGIVAARISELTGRPVLLGGCRDGVVRGSGRSIPGFDLIAALQSVAENGLFDRYGGHPAAVGFTLPAALVPELQRRLEMYTRRQWPHGLPPRTLTIQETLPIHALTPTLVRELQVLAPHGMGWPPPCFLVRGRIHEVRVIQKRHLQLIISNNGFQVHAWWWEQADFSQTLLPGMEIAAVGHLEWRHRGAGGMVQLLIADVAVTPYHVPPVSLPWD